MTFKNQPLPSTSQIARVVGNTVIIPNGGTIIGGEGGGGGGGGTVTLPIKPADEAIIEGSGFIALTDTTINSQIQIGNPTGGNVTTFVSEDITFQVAPPTVTESIGNLSKQGLVLSEITAVNPALLENISSTLNIDGLTLKNVADNSRVLLGERNVTGTLEGSELVKNQLLIKTTPAAPGVTSEIKLTHDGFDIVSSTPQLGIQPPDFTSPVNFYNSFVNAFTTYEAVIYIPPTGGGQPPSYRTGISIDLPMPQGATREFNLFNNTQTLFQKYVCGVRSSDTPLTLVNYTGGNDGFNNFIMPIYDIGIRQIEYGVGGVNNQPTFPPNTPITGIVPVGSVVSQSCEGLQCIIKGYSAAPPIPAFAAGGSANYVDIDQTWSYINSSLANGLAPVIPTQANILSNSLDYLPGLRYINSSLRGGVQINMPTFKASTYVTPGQAIFAITCYPTGLMPIPRLTYFGT